MAVHLVTWKLKSLRWIEAFLMKIFAKSHFFLQFRIIFDHKSISFLPNSKYFWPAHSFPWPFPQPLKNWKVWGETKYLWQKNCKKFHFFSFGLLLTIKVSRFYLIPNIFDPLKVFLGRSFRHLKIGKFELKRSISYKKICKKFHFFQFWVIFDHKSISF